MNKDQLHDRLTELAEEALEGAQSFKPEALGLDTRCSYIPMQVTAECVAVHASYDRSTQYYGGFEYIDKANRTECGNWVLYFAEDCDRVQTCIDTALDVDDSEVIDGEYSPDLDENGNPIPLD